MILHSTAVKTEITFDAFTDHLVIHASLQMVLSEVGFCGHLCSFPPQHVSPDTLMSPMSGGDRKKWEAGAPLVLSVAQQTLEESCIKTTGELYQPKLSPSENLLE